MKTLRAMLVRFVGLFRRKQHEADMNGELRAHLEGLIERNLAAGLPPEEARYAALRAFGGVAQIAERARDERRSVWGEHVLQDLRYAVRQLRKTPGFTVVAAISLALGIGANTAIFSLVNEVLLKTLPVRNPDELVIFRSSGLIVAYAPRWMMNNGDGGIDPATGRRTSNSFSPVMFTRLEETSSSLSDVVAFGPLPQLNAIIDGAPEIVPLTQIVSGNYYTALGVPAAAGRMLAVSDDQEQASPVAVISHRYWQRRFDEDPTAVGKAIWLNNVAVTIVGVAPANFPGTLQIGESPDFTLPLTLAARVRADRADLYNRRQASYWWLRIMGRLKPAVTREQVRAELQPVFHQTVLDAFPNTDLPLPHLHVDAGAQGLAEARSTYRHSLLILTGLVALILVIACMNVANLLLARAAARRREIAVRLALGAGRRRIVRQLLTESLLLALLGGGLGALFAWWGKDLLLVLRPAAFTSTTGSGLTLELSLDGSVLSFTIVVAVATGILFGLVPALRATRVDLISEFQGGSYARGRSGSSRLARILMVAQVALSLMLLVGAGLFARTLRNLQAVNVGFNRSHLLLFRLDAVAGGHARSAAANLYQHVREGVAGLPGVQAASYSLLPLLSRVKTGGGGGVLGLGGETVGGDVNGVGADFLRTFEMPLLLGRTVTAQDEATDAGVAVINEAFVQQFFPGQSPIGRRTTLGEIIGVVRDAKYADVKESVEPTAYVPFRRAAAHPMGLNGHGNFAVRTTMEPRALLGAIQKIVREIDPKLPVFDVRTQEEQIARLLRQERLFAQLSGFFGGLAMLLVCVGLYGLMSFAVLQRTREIGIRMALGALPRRVLWMIVRESLGLVMLGVVLGIGGAMAAVRLVMNLLYGLSPTDAPTYGAVALLLVTVALLAALLPACRAAKIDPMVALRAE